MLRRRIRRISSVIADPDLTGKTGSTSGFIEDPRTLCVEAAIKVEVPSTVNRSGESRVCHLVPQLQVPSADVEGTSAGYVSDQVIHIRIEGSSRLNLNPHRIAKGVIPIHRQRGSVGDDHVLGIQNSTPPACATSCEFKSAFVDENRSPGKIVPGAIDGAVVGKVLVDVGNHIPGTRSFFD